MSIEKFHDEVCSSEAMVVFIHYWTFQWRIWKCTGIDHKLFSSSIGIIYDLSAIPINNVCVALDALFVP